MTEEKGAQSKQKLPVACGHLPVDNLDWPPTPIAPVKQSLVALCELVLLAEGTKREQSL